MHSVGRVYNLQESEQGKHTLVLDEAFQSLGDEDTQLGEEGAALAQLAQKQFLLITAGSHYLKELA